MRVTTASILRIVTAAMAASCGGRVASVEEAVPATESTSTRPPSTMPSGPTPPTTSTPPKPLPPEPPAECTTPKELLGPSTATCADVWYLPCGVPADIDPNGPLSMDDCERLCGPFPEKNGRYWGCTASKRADLPGPSFECFTCVAGRRPAGFHLVASNGSVAGWLAAAALLEHASIDAFEILARELGDHGAPSRLVHGALRAARDEIRHTRAMAALARREGADVTPSLPPRRASRPLLEIALENAVEGCVREAYGAVVAAWQARHAARQDVRRVASAIAPDEASHADLAWRIHAWALPKLSASERGQVERALRDAFADLRAAAAQPVPPELADELGLPRAADALRLVAGLEADLVVELVA